MCHVTSNDNATFSQTAFCQTTTLSFKKTLKCRLRKSPISFYFLTLQPKSNKNIHINKNIINRKEILMEYVTLNNGVKMPQLGYGLYLIDNSEAARCTRQALETGYRLIDTAQMYGNESGVGEGIRESGVDRKDIFLVSKIWPSDYGYEKAKARIDKSLELLKTDYLDLMLLHQPFGDTYGAYRALEDAYREGKIRAIGVSNFYADGVPPSHLTAVG
jgi:hypothetical protein